MSLNNLSLPTAMSFVRGFVDPLNDSNFYIFGSANRNECYYFKSDVQKYMKLKSIPKKMTQAKVYQHGCAKFKINNKYYALIYGGDMKNSYFQIYDTENKEWDNKISQYNDLWCNDENIMNGGLSIYGFGDGLSMINDISDENIIHIAGGGVSRNKYGIFKMNHDFNKDNQSNPPITLGPELPDWGLLRTHLFYFNVRGSNNKNDIKLVSMIKTDVNQKYIDFVYLNDETKEWQRMKYREQWELPMVKSGLRSPGMAFWWNPENNKTVVFVIGGFTFNYSRQTIFYAFSDDLNLNKNKNNNNNDSIWQKSEIELPFDIAGCQCFILNNKSNYPTLIIIGGEKDYIERSNHWTFQFSEILDCHTFKNLTMDYRKFNLVLSNFARDLKYPVEIADLIFSFA